MSVSSDDLLRTRLKRNFHGFVRHFWGLISPFPLDDAWYVKALCLHLQCMVIDCDERVRWASEGNNLLINIPPRPVAYDAIIDSSRGKIALDEVMVGDAVLTHRGRFREVTAVHDQGILPVLRINSGGVTVDAARDHPFLTPNGWVNIGDIGRGDLVGMVSGPSEDTAWSRVDGVVPHGYTKCRCLTVEEDASFVANGFAVHNTGKSVILSVLFPAWAWARDPKLRFVTASYAKEFAGRDSKNTRTLMETAEYRRLFPDTRLRPGQNLAHRYYTTAGGYRVTMSVESGTTGEGGDIQIFDDPHDISDSVSKRKRDYAIYYYKKIFFNRTETPDRARRIVCGQRVHAQDLSSELIQSEKPIYTHLVFPEEYDPKISKATPLFTDPRIKEGDLLRPRRFGPKEVEEAKSPSGLGRKTYAAVYQQKPMDDEGNMFLRRWFDDRILTHFPADVYNWIRTVDLACTEKNAKNTDPDWTASSLTGTSNQYPFVIGDVRRVREEQPGVDRFMVETSNLDFARFNKWIPSYIEAVAGFKAVVQHMMNAKDVMRGRPCFPMYIPAGFNKRARAVTLQSCAEGRGVWMVQGQWIPEFLEELCTFGGLDEKGNEYSEYTTTHDDMVDSVTAGYNRHYADGGGQLRASANRESVSLGQASLMAPTSPRQQAFQRMAQNGNRTLHR